MGSHNLLLALGSSVYLEVAAVDPEAAPIARPRWFGLDGVIPAARLAGWVASTDHIQSAAPPDLGFIETMQRDGRTWQMTATADGALPLSGAAPLLIQRSSATHPAAVLPESGLCLRELCVRHPEPARVSSLLSRIGFAMPPRVTVLHDSVSRLVATIETPLGLRVLGDA